MMDLTPQKKSSLGPADFAIVADEQDVASRSRPKRPPPVTPRRFTRFFTPRPRNAVQAVRTSRKALRDITRPGANRARQPRQSRFDLADGVDKLPSIEEQPIPKPSRKRKYSTYSATPSLQSSPIKRAENLCSSQGTSSIIRTQNENLVDEEAETDHGDFERDSDSDDESEEQIRVPAVIPYRLRSTSASILSTRITGQRVKREARCSQAWQDEASSFYTSPQDVYSCDTSSGHDALPFCTTSCNTNSLIAVGDEEGNVRLVDSATRDEAGFRTTFLKMKPHDNALMDLEFSEDDRLLATGSGDQTSQVIDMRTQRSIFCMAGHSSSIKQVQFQPGSGSNILATCSRDGNVNIWDLRSRSLDRTSPSLHLRSSARTCPVAQDDSMRYIPPTTTFRDAHGSRWAQKDLRSRVTLVSGRNEFSVTSLSFLGSGREHMLVTASEAHAVVKVWDLRATHYNARRHRAAAAVSITKEPPKHALHRRFGLTSLALSGDGARLYALCRDNTIYAYSTSHLILGDSQDLANNSFRASHRIAAGTGLGPIYGFRHPRLRVSTFYPKLSIRRSQDGNSELLAAGSSDECAVVFPTNERYLTKARRLSTGITLLAPNRSASTETPIPIYQHGTPLVRGHRKEVTDLTWTSEGSLVTVSDDFSTRCWREDATRARSLRQMGEGGGKRWKAGWAEVQIEGYDDE